MGFSCFMKVFVETRLEDFVDSNRHRCLNSDKEKDPDIEVKVQQWIQVDENRSKFFDNITVCSFDDSEFAVDYGEEDGEDNDQVKFKPEDHAELILFELLFLAIIDKDPKLNDYLKIFDNLDGISFSSKVVKIHISYESSYKGSEKLRINFKEIYQKSRQIKNMYSTAIVYTQLGMS